MRAFRSKSVLGRGGIGCGGWLGVRGGGGGGGSTRERERLTLTDTWFIVKATDPYVRREVGGRGGGGGRGAGGGGGGGMKVYYTLALSWMI